MKKLQKLRVRFIRPLIVGLLLMPLITSVLRPQPAQAAIVKPKLWVYGDSINWESYKYIKSSGLGATYAVVQKAFPGIAVCDMINEFNKEWAVIKPAAIPTTMVAETVGNSFTTSCMINPDTGTYYVPGTPEYYQKYSDDITTFANLVTSKGVQLLFIAPPPMKGADGSIQSHIEEYEAATGNPVTYGPQQAVAPGNVYVDYLPCMKGEGLTKGCVAGQIQVRSSDGVHFCPSGLPTFPNYCPVYSSGENRWGDAIGLAVRQAFGL